VHIISWNIAFHGPEAAKRQGGLLRELAPDLILCEELNPGAAVVLADAAGAHWMVRSVTYVSQSRNRSALRQARTARCQPVFTFLTVRFRARGPPASVEMQDQLFLRGNARRNERLVDRLRAILSISRVGIDCMVHCILEVIADSHKLFNQLRLIGILCIKSRQ